MAKMKSQLQLPEEQRLLTPREKFWKNMARDRYLLMMLIVPTILMLVFNYLPMFGNIIAFQNYKAGDSFINPREWVGLDHFVRFFESPHAGRLIKNTVLLSLFSILFGMPVPLIFALIMNELHHGKGKRAVQTVACFPNFISTVVVVGIILSLFSDEGVVNQALALLGAEPAKFFADPKYFRTMYIASGIWQTFGWGSLLYLSAFSAIDPALYEAAAMDGASRFQQMRYITLPHAVATFSIQFILNMGSIFAMSADKILLMQTPAIYETADVIATYVYRAGITGGQYSFTTAIGLMNSVLNLILIVTFNKVAKKANMASFW